ncbi:TonB-dependent receptor [Confluentibacter sediminis]|uniref:TonB-dependent receptor n=1 Tax=Confluentibacter sediminis TaxID=2219045 RepID=UPI000DAB9858|nr:TonB-dependent receptor [Confluentibacter sediminis]
MKYIFIILLFNSALANSQNTFNIEGTITSNRKSLPYANIYIENTAFGQSSNENGKYIIKNIEPGTYTIRASFTGYKTIIKKIEIVNENLKVNFELEETESLNEIVITGTLKAVNSLETPIPVEVYSATFFKKNPTPNIFEALQNINGVRPQINCNVCNTGDIHINGLEGPYTLVLIDGMPIVSGLSTVYGLSGIPNSLIEQVEIVKGPASSLYGSEAVGGLINIITKLPKNAPLFFADSFTTSWGEFNLDVGLKAKIGENGSLLLGTNYFNYNNPIDNNHDNFTDVPLQERISVFQKWEFKQKKGNKLSLASRFFYEDRWGGELQWNKSFRGGDAVYGESIYTKRYEIIGNYELPIKEKVRFQFSYSDHDQNSVYGTTLYLAKQRIGFGQFIWDKTLNHHDLLFGVGARYNFYNDNTTATPKADVITIPSVFVQDEIKLSERQKLLLGMRYDYDDRHGSILTPRMAYSYKLTEDDILRVNAGTGFRVVNLFTEEHAALTGARDVVITETLNPETSYNMNINYLKKIHLKSGMIFTFDASAWYTYFKNAIIPDYDTNPNQIIYNNLDGFSTTKGFSFNFDSTFNSNFKALLGFTFQDVSKTENSVKSRPILSEKFSGTWALSYKNHKTNILVDYSGNLYGPMRLPLLGSLDPRQAYSPTWSIQNIQFTYDGLHHFEFYAGVKNLLNWTPDKGNPFIIARAHDPFDKNVEFDSNGQVMPTDENPYALTFDPSYVYAPNQGRRLFFGLRYKID